MCPLHVERSPILVVRYSETAEDGTKARAIASKDPSFDLFQSLWVRQVCHGYSINDKRSFSCLSGIGTVIKLQLPTDQDI